MTSNARTILHRIVGLFRRYGSALAVLVLWSCATSIPPDGGPPDTEPPSIIDTEPLHGSTNISEGEVRFVFSEYVDRNSFQQAVHISPLMPEPPRFDWSGKEVTLIFPEDLKPDKTYVISVGTTVKDVNAGNPMKSSYTLAFSTGDSLDAGIIRGRVYDDDPAGITAFAYQLDAIDPDTLNPATLRPDYALQTDERGEFVLSNLAAGRYRVFAVRDKQKDYMYTPGSDAIGVAEEDVTTGSDSSMAPLRYLLHVQDTTAPYIQSVRAVTARSIELRVSEPPLANTLAVSSIAVLDSATAAPIPIVDVLPVPGKNRSFTVHVSGDLEEKTYALAIDSLMDNAGNLAHPGSDVISFTGIAEPDTARPDILEVYPAPNSKDVLPDSLFTITFSRPMAITAGVRLEDSSVVEIPLEAFWKTPHTLVLTHPELAYGMQYSLCIGLATFTDSLNQRTVADSTLCYSFATVDAEVNGSITGAVELKRPTSSPIRVTARATVGVWTKTTTADGTTFSFPKVPEGKYILESYIDADTSGTYTFGTAYPFTPAERFGRNQDTIRVRARWESEGADITIP